MSAELREFTSADLAERLGGRLAGDGSIVVRGVNGLDAAGPDDVTFVADKPHAAQWPASRAAVAVASAGLDVAPVGPGRAVVHVPDAELALATILALFQPEELRPRPGVHPTAWVHPGAEIADGVAVGPHVSIDDGCRIGAGVVLHPGVRIYAGVTIGEGSTLHANVVVRERCRIGGGVIIHQNVSIGSDGFGYRPAPDGSGLVKMPHIGDVVIEDQVEIGAGTCIDRAKFGSTVIGAGTKIDNLVQIAHNCRIGRACAIAGMTGIAGSATLGDGVLIGGGVAIADHRRIGDGAGIGARASVMNDVPAGETWLGTPATPAREALRQAVALRKLPELVRRLTSGAEGGARSGTRRPPAGATSD